MYKLVRNMICLVSIVWLGNFMILLWPLNERAIYGEMFGIANSLFSGLAFFGIILTLYMQTQQHKVGTVQQYENTFFQLINIHRQNVQDIDLRLRSGNVDSGRDCFRRFYNSYRSIYTKKHITSMLDAEQYINVSYLNFYEMKHDNLAHYFQTLYNIVKYVDESAAINDKKKYINLLRAQLSVYELGLIFYNCISDLGRVKFKPLLVKYSMFKNMPKTILFDRSHIELYDKNAFLNAPPWTNSYRFDLSEDDEFASEFMKAVIEQEEK